MNYLKSIDNSDLSNKDEKNIVTSLLSEILDGINNYKYVSCDA